MVLLIAVPMARLSARQGWVVRQRSTAMPVASHPPAFVGGIVMALGMLSAASFATPLAWPIELAIATLVVLVAGLLRSVGRISARQLGVAVLPAAIVVATTYGFADDAGVGLTAVRLAFGAAVVFMVAAAFILVDRADGLVEGLSLVASLTLVFAVNLTAPENPSDQVPSSLIPVALALIGSLLALAAFSWCRPRRRQALLIPGLGGSALLGVTLGWLSLRAHDDLGDSGFGLGVLLWVFAIPLADAGMYVLRHLFIGKEPRGATPFRAIHLAEVQLYTRGGAVITIVGISAILAGLGLMLWRYEVSGFVLCGLYALAFAIYSGAWIIYWKRRTHLKKSDWTQIKSRDASVGRTRTGSEQSR